MSDKIEPKAGGQYAAAFLADAYGLERPEAQAIINAAGTDRTTATNLARAQKARNDARTAQLAK